MSFFMLYYNTGMENSLKISNEDMFNVFDNIKHALDEYYIKLLGSDADSDSEVYYHVREHVNIMIDKSVKFFNDEVSFQQITSEGFYSFKGVLELFRQYVSSMSVVFIERAEKFYSDFDDQQEDFDNIFETVNKTVIVIVMEQLLSAIFDATEVFNDSMMLDLARAELQSETIMKNDEQFNSIVSSNMWDFDVETILSEHSEEDEQ